MKRRAYRAPKLTESARRYLAAPELVYVLRREGKVRLMEDFTREELQEIAVRYGAVVKI